MNTALILPDSTATYPSTGMLPTDIIVEECLYDEGDPDFEMVKTIGKQYAENLFNHKLDGLAEYCQYQINWPPRS